MSAAGDPVSNHDPTAAPPAEGFDRTPETLETLEVTTGQVVIIDADLGASEVVRGILESDGHRVHISVDVESAVLAFSLFPPDIIVIDPFAKGFPGVSLIDQIPRSSTRGPEIVVTTAHNDVESAVAALHRGAIDYIVKPLNTDRLRLAVVRAMEKHRLVEENIRLRRDLALSAAGQRFLETLDGEVLSAQGLEALMTFTQANAAVILASTGDARVESSRGLSSDELSALAVLDLPLPIENHFAPRDLTVGLSRFDDALFFDLGEQRRVVLFRMRGRFVVDEVDDARFLVRHLTTALKNVLRYTSAERRARRDPLTGLFNARAFEEAVNQAAIRASVDGVPFSILFLDIDRFKLVNDRHGHLIGSRLLTELGQVIPRVLRDGSIVARYGGDEFVVLLPGIDDQAAPAIAERIRAKIASHPFLTREGLGLNITTCIGVASYPTHARHAHALLDMADRAMYLGKHAERNMVHAAARIDDDQGEMT
jgi:two-component system cell cycle response regulator